MMSEADPAALNQLCATLAGRTSTARPNARDPGVLNGDKSVSIREKPVSTEAASAAAVALQTLATNVSIAKTGNPGAARPQTSSEGPQKTSCKSRAASTTKIVRKTYTSTTVRAPPLQDKSGGQPHKKSTRCVSPTKTPIKNGMQEPVLSADQQRAVDLVLEGKNVFFTGKSGAPQRTGSFLHTFSF